MQYGYVTLYYKSWFEGFFFNCKRRHYCLSDILRITEELVYKGDWKYISIFSGDAFVSRKNDPSAFSLLVFGPEMVEVLTLFIFFSYNEPLFLGLECSARWLQMYEIYNHFGHQDSLYHGFFVFFFFFFLKNSAKFSPKSWEF